MALPEDTDLKPVPAAQAEIDRLAAANAGGQPKTTAKPSPVSFVIEPADPDQWTRTVALQYPILVDGVRIDTLTLRRLSSRALTNIIMADDNEESINLRARAAIAGLHPDVLMALDADDGVEVAEAIRPFLPRALLGVETLEMDILAAAANRADGEA